MDQSKTHFRRVDYELSTLLHCIDIGDIGLPDIQRPFVWPNTKVRDLFDSMYRGFPVGYLLFWENSRPNGAKQIGADVKAHTVPNRLIVDGQQRLTSLYAVFRGKVVRDANYRVKKIEIAFRPRDGRFDVCNAAIRKDAEWIPSISDLWTSGKSSYGIVSAFLRTIEASRAQLTEEDRDAISRNLDRLWDLQRYPFTVLEIAPTVAEEQVADIFVRINSEGVKLNQADFILTLMSVFWDEGRNALELFCRRARVVPALGDPASPFNYLIEPDPDQLLKVSVAIGFRRARLQAVYNILRGKNVETGEVDSEQRERQFDKLNAAQARVLNLTHWHGYLNAIRSAGFRGSELISSQNALMYSYAFYLLGREEFGVPEDRLRRIIGRWFFFSSLTGRYTGSPESTMDGDLNRLRGLSVSSGFEASLEEAIDSELTHDYWTVTLPAELETSSARNPQRSAYVAAQILLKAPILFSANSVKDLWDPVLKTPRKALEWHHLFPRAWLERSGIEERTRINQQANLALLEWPENAVIGDRPPSEYVPLVRHRFNDAEWSNMHILHGLPDGWELMTYEQFLAERRHLMAQVIRRGFEAL